MPPEDDDEDSGPATETVEVAGRAIRYLTRGEGGTPVILIHGFGGDLNNWLFNHEALAAKRVVHALDLPGHGSSSKDVGDGRSASSPISSPASPMRWRSKPLISWATPWAGPSRSPWPARRHSGSRRSP